VATRSAIAIVCEQHQSQQTNARTAMRHEPIKLRSSADRRVVENDPLLIARFHVKRAMQSH
jgi:hypothetical protein